MPNVLVRPEQMCKANKHDGTPCQAPRRRGQPFCITHSPGQKKLAEDRAAAHSKLVAAVPSDPLHVLSRLDFTDPSNLTRLKQGLLEHVMAGSLIAPAASQVLKFAESIAAAAPRKDRAASDAMVAKVLASTPPPVDD